MRQIEDRKRPIQLLMDRLMNYYGPAVYIVALLAFVGWYLHSGDASRAVLVSVSVIILGYPCASGLTTPLILAIGGGHGVARGLLVRAAEFFQALSETDTVIFDKTGTLTYGRPTVSNIIAFDGTEEDVLATIAAVEFGSEHPLAKAIVRYSQFNEVLLPEASAFKAIAGKGVIATIASKITVVGRSFLASEGIRLDEAALGRTEALEQSHTVIYAASDGRLIGAIALQDMPRPGAARAIERLKSLGLRTTILTGDSRAIAEQLVPRLESTKFTPSYCRNKGGRYRSDAGRGTRRRNGWRRNKRRARCGTI